MAIVKYPPGSPGENRSFSGATFTKNSSGSIIRARRKPLLKRTPATTQSRTNFRNVVSNYRNNTPAEKLGWSSKTPQFIRVNSLGQSYQLQGNQLFGSLNQNKVNEGDSINFTPQDAAAFPSILLSGSSLSVDPIALTLFLNSPTIPPDYRFSFWFTFVFNSINSWSFPNDYKLIDSFGPGTYLQFPFVTSYWNNWSRGPSVIPSVPQWFYIGCLLEATYIPSGEKKQLSSLVASSFQ